MIAGAREAVGPCGLGSSQVRKSSGCDKPRHLASYLRGSAGVTRESGRAPKCPQPVAGKFRPKLMGQTGQAAPLASPWRPGEALALLSSTRRTGRAHGPAGLALAPGRGLGLDEDDAAHRTRPRPRWRRLGARARSWPCSSRHGAQDALTAPLASPWRSGEVLALMKSSRRTGRPHGPAGVALASG